MNRRKRRVLTLYSDEILKIRRSELFYPWTEDREYCRLRGLRTYVKSITNFVDDSFSRNDNYRNVRCCFNLFQLHNDLQTRDFRCVN